jgi:hypothetical protein
MVEKELDKMPIFRVLYVRQEFFKDPWQMPSLPSAQGKALSTRHALSKEAIFRSVAIIIYHEFIIISWLLHCRFWMLVVELGDL